VTQNDGKILWSAPVWVTQTNGGDTTAPTVRSRNRHQRHHHAVGQRQRQRGRDPGRVLCRQCAQGSSSTAPYSRHAQLDHPGQRQPQPHRQGLRCGRQRGRLGRGELQRQQRGIRHHAPAVTASESGGSGTITLSASASDNVGVSKVEFYVDGVLKGTDTASPYTMTLNSTTLANGSHALTAKAYDAAGNSTVSAAVNFSINNATSTSSCAQQRLRIGRASWTATSAA
jgi:hypothetical protein